jgi:hypothetical protein
MVSYIKTCIGMKKCYKTHIFNFITLHWFPKQTVYWNQKVLQNSTKQIMQWHSLIWNPPFFNFHCDTITHGKPNTTLNVCNDIVSNLRNENVMLHAKIDELNICKPSTSTIEHVSICTRCRDVNVDAIHDHIAMIKQQNDHIAKLDAKIAEHELENEKFKFARSMLYSGRRSGIKDDIGFQQGGNVKLNAPKRLSNFVKGKAPMAQDNEGYILYPAGYPEHKIRRIHSRKSHSSSHHAFMYKSEASSSRQSTHVKLPKKKSSIASNEHNI